MEQIYLKIENMKSCRFRIIVVLLVVGLCSTQAAWAYESTIFEPFSSEVPSDQTVVGSQYTTEQEEASNSASRANARRGFGNVTDGDNQDQGSPIGDPVWPMLAFALFAAGVVCIRRTYSYNKK